MVQFQASFGAYVIDYSVLWSMSHGQATLPINKGAQALSRVRCWRYTITFPPVCCETCGTASAGSRPGVGAHLAVAGLVACVLHPSQALSGLGKHRLGHGQQPCQVSRWRLGSAGSLLPAGLERDSAVPSSKPRLRSRVCSSGNSLTRKSEMSLHLANDSWLRKTWTCARTCKRPDG